MNGYTKLFSTIITSTIWQEPIEVKVLWITMLAMADKHGHVSGSIPGLAHVAGISIESCQKGIDTLSAPDPYSRTKAEGGRRIMATDGGWDLVNHAKYRELLSKEERRQYLAMKQRESRERRKAAEQPVNNPSTNVNERGDKSTKSTQAESDASPDTDPLLNLSQSSSGTPALPPPEPKQQKRVKRMTVPDADWLVEVKAVEAYKGIDVAREFSKAKVWFDTRGKVLSRGRFLNWLNRCEKPLTGQLGIQGTNRHQMPAATKEQHAKGFFSGLEDELGIPKEQPTAQTAP